MQKHIKVNDNYFLTKVYDMHVGLMFSKGDYAVKRNTNLGLTANELTDKALEDVQGGIFAFLLPALGVNLNPKCSECGSKNVEYIMIGKSKHVTHCNSCKRDF